MTGRHPAPDHELVHGTCVAIAGAGVLILGPPGSGKSDLALRLIDEPGCGISSTVKSAELVSDDQVVVRRDGEALIAAPPATIAGLLEVRGLGIVRLPSCSAAPLRLVIRLANAQTIERLPELESQHYDILGVRLPMVEIDAALASAAARVRAALDHVKRD